MPVVPENSQVEQPSQAWGFVERCVARHSLDPVFRYVPQSVVTQECQAAQNSSGKLLHGQSALERLDTCVANRVKYMRDNGGQPFAADIVGPGCAADLHIPWYEIPPWHAAASAGPWLLSALIAFALLAAHRLLARLQLARRLPRINKWWLLTACGVAAAVVALYLTSDSWTLRGLWRGLAAPALAAMLGTAAGATVAFWAEQQSRNVRLEDDRVTATNTAIFKLANIWDDLESYREKHLEKERNNSERWYMLHPRPFPAPPAFDAVSLAYLFELPGAAPNLPMRVQFALGEYASVYWTATERNKVHNEEAQPAVEKSIRATHGSDLPVRDRIANTLGGTRVTATLEGLTDDLINMIDDLIRSIPETVRDLRQAALAQFPDRQIIQFERVPAAATN